MKVCPISLRQDSKTANIYLNLRKSLYTKGKQRGRCCPNTYLYIYLANLATFTPSPSAGLRKQAKIISAKSFCVI